MPSYRPGLIILATVVGLSCAACLATIDATARPRAAQDLGDSGPRLGSFRFTERSGRTVTDADLANDVWIAAFIFTRCRSSCPVITAAMSGLQADLADSPVRLVSISVDPEHDTPTVLSEFAQTYRADPDRWWFLTGDREATYDLIRKGFLQAVAETTEAERSAGAEAIAHSYRLALVDRGNRVVSFFNSNDVAEVDTLAERARSLAKLNAAPAWARRLPAVNAALNGTSALVLLLGWSLIRARRVRGHTAAMISALVLSALFLACYLVYHYQVGSVRFRGSGPARVAYFSILLSHTVLAVLMVPMILVTVVRALSKRFDRHRRIASITFPIWVYVSVTGVVIYWMLYQVDWSRHV